LNKISIIIPSYNAINTLRTCLENIIEMDEVEILVVDDASSDGTYEYLLDKGIKTIKLSKNMGVAKARNVGAKHSLGNYLFFLDSDIIVNHQVIKNMAKYLDQHKNVHAIGAFASKNNLNNSFSSDFIHLRALWSASKLSGNFVENFSGLQSECGMIRRETFFKVGGFPETHGGVGSEEYHLGHILMQNNFKSVLSLELLYDTYWKTLTERFFNLITRTKRWAPLFYNRWKLESQGTTGTIQEFYSCALTLLSNLSIILILGLGLPLKLIPIIFLLHFLGESKFLLFAYKSHSFKMMLFSWPAIQAINTAILFGFFLGTLDWFTKNEVRA
jgi:glycosyltransferase involved in cell wall biosynthesis